MFARHAAWGVRAAAAGVAVGGLLMVLVQLPSFVARLPSRAARRGARDGPPPASAPRRDSRTVSRCSASACSRPSSSSPLCRQSQVLVERFLASPLPAGAISHLNYAQKVAQMPMVLSLMLCTVTFPVVARAMADGDTERARRRVERDLALAGSVVLLGAATSSAARPQIIELLFQRGAFDARDTAATAAVMRVYGSACSATPWSGALVRPYFSAARPTWYPGGGDGCRAPRHRGRGGDRGALWGVHGIAAANAVGITTSGAPAAVRAGCPCGRHRRPRAWRPDWPGCCSRAPRPPRPAGAPARLVPDPLAAALAGGVTVLVVFAAVAHLVRAPEVPQLFATVKRRLAHVQ